MQLRIGVPEGEMRNAPAKFVWLQSDLFKHSILIK